MLVIPFIILNKFNKPIKYFRENSQHFKAWHYLLLGKSIGFPSNDLLFMEKEVYSYLFDYYS